MPVQPRWASTLFATFAGCTLILACLAPGSTAQAREPKSGATPFVVGGGIVGSYLSAINAGSRNDTFAASTYFREVLRHDPDNNMVLQRAFVATMANGDLKDAFSIAQKLVKKDRNHSLGRLALAVRAIKARHFITARTHLSRGQKKQPGEITGALLNAWAWSGSRKASNALDILDKLSNPALKPYKDYHAALVLKIAKKQKDALQRMKLAYPGLKNSVGFVLTYAAMLMDAGDKPQALKVLTELKKVLPRHPTVLAAIKDVEAGKRPREYVTNSVEGAAEVLFQLSTVGNRRGRELVPMIYLRLALHLAPKHDQAIIALADIYERLKQHSSAIDAYMLTPKSSPLYHLAQLQIGNELDSLGKKDEALKHLQKLARDNPKDSEAVLAVANLQRSRKAFAIAAKLYTTALELAPDKGKANWTTYYYRAICYERIKKWPLAEADFKKALELYPDHPSVLNYLGYSWVDKGMNLTEAFRLLRRAVELRPTDGAIVDSLGWAYYRLGKYEDALRELERAVELRPADPVINDHLGDVYWKVGRKLEAGFQWNHARDLDPEAKDKVRILRKIKVGLDVVEAEEAKTEKTRKSEIKPAGKQAPAAANEGQKKSGG